MVPLEDREAWAALKAHRLELDDVHLVDLFREDPERASRFSEEAVGIYLDYSKNRITERTRELLVQLAHESGLPERIEAMFRGDRINVTEGRSVLHVALRAPRDESIVVDGEDVVIGVHDVLDQMARFCDVVRSGEWKGATGRPIKNIVNIGIGGSDLGPVMAYEALRAFSRRDLRFRFVSNVDATDFVENTHDLDPAETLFIVCSKTFTTLETMTNAHTARRWLVEAMGGDESAVEHHFVAVSTNSEAVAAFGIAEANTFAFWDWVGGRYSMTSAIGLSTMLAVGESAFREMLDGFHEMDVHFRTADLAHNLPVLMGLISIWHNDFFDADTVAVLPYNQYLKRFPAYLQQLTMESNGKQVTIDGRLLTVQSSPIYWGEPGTNGQHSFYQLLHQGTRIVPCDFIGFVRSLNPIGEHHDLLTANVFAQAQALAFGRSADEVRADGTPEWLVPHRVFEGDRPSTVLLLEEFSPRALGRLVALYEHSVFTQGVIWELNSFDQWGVELGKSLAGAIASDLSAPEDSPASGTHDGSTAELIRRYRAGRAEPEPT